MCLLSVSSFLASSRSEGPRVQSKPTEEILLLLPKPAMNSLRPREIYPIHLLPPPLALAPRPPAPTSIFSENSPLKRASSLFGLSVLHLSGRECYNF